MTGCRIQTARRDLESRCGRNLLLPGSWRRSPNKPANGIMWRAELKMVFGEARRFISELGGSNDRFWLRRMHLVPVVLSSRGGSVLLFIVRFGLCKWRPPKATTVLPQNRQLRERTWNIRKQPRKWAGLSCAEQQLLSIEFLHMASLYHPHLTQINSLLLIDHTEVIISFH